MEALQITAVLGLIAIAIGLYWRETFPIEGVSIGVLVAFLLLFHVTPPPTHDPEFGAAALLSGFANPALVTIMALLVVGQGMFQTGATEGPARALANLSERAPRAALALIYAIVFIVSAFLNNTPVVVMFIPIFAAVARRMGAPASKLMIPLSFVCILAGMTTLIGSSTNLLIADALDRLTDERLAFFTQTVPGLFLAGVGLIYMALIGGRLLPTHASLEDDYAGGAADGRQFIAQIDVTPGHPLVGAKPVAGLFPDLPNITVRLIQRRERVLLPPFDNIALRAGDSIIVAATRQRLTELLSSRAGFLRGALHAEGGAGLEEDPGASFEVIEAVVAPGARIIERTIEQSGIHAMTGAIVLGVQRRSRMMRGRLADIRLAAGDVLLIMGSPESLHELRRLRDLLLLEGSTSEVPDLRRAVYARVIFAGMVVLAATGLVPILHAAMLGALSMIAARCLNLRQAARALDLKVYLLIGAAFAMGGALESTGSAEMIASAVTTAAAPFGPIALLSAIFLLVIVFTNILSNSATAILFAPIAITAAEQAGADPAPFALTVLFAANCSFVTPIAYQTNLLVMGPGRYHFADFARIGAPLALVIWIAFTLTAPLWFDLAAIGSAVGGAAGP